MNGEAPVVIVGAGPAGVRAAQTLVSHGVRPVVVDEGLRAGGQIYRQRPAPLAVDARKVYGFEAARATRVHEAFEALQANIDYRPQTLVWGVDGRVLNLLHQPSQRMSALQASEIILATGATDRVLPVPGWTLPGVFSLGGAQVALKFQSTLIGQHVVFVGTGPLLYLVAWQYLRAGAHVVAVLDTTPRATAARALPALWSHPLLLAKGLHYMARLRLSGVPLRAGVHRVRIQGDARAAGVHWRENGTERSLDCDAVGLGHGLRSESQLADLLGCQFAYSPIDRAFVPATDSAGRTSVSGIYAAGDGALIRGADAAEAAGERAALTLLADRGVAVDTARAARIDHRLNRLTRFRSAMEQAFPVPEAWTKEAPDELVVCRCENITAAELRSTALASGATELNRLKALCRVGMGRCQGRMCAAAAAELLADAHGLPLHGVGRLRAQMPLKPLPVAAEGDA